MAGLPQNNMALNRAALRWLKEARARAPNHYLHLLNLAHYGLEMGQAENWGENRAAIRQQVDGLFGWKAADALLWMLSNPEAGDREEQQASLHRLLETSEDPESAAGHVLWTIWRRQVSQNPALQPAASEWS